MRYFPILALVLFSSAPLAGTIQPNQMQGEWQLYTPQGFRHKLAAFISGASFQKMSLTISSKDNIVFERELLNGDVETIQSSRVEQIEDLIIIYLTRPRGGMYKLVLSGWKTGNSKQIFGYFYLYDQNGLFNGWPVSFIPKQ